MSRLKIACFWYFTWSSCPLSAAVIIARVYAIFMREPTPYAPPVQPVFTSHTRAWCFAIRSPSILAYTFGLSGRNGAPKHVLKVAFGSVTPFSVPATFAVYPERKWYIAPADERREIGGSTPNASAVSMMMLRG